MINFAGGEQNFKRGMLKRGDRDWTTLPTWMVFNITNLQKSFLYSPLKQILRGSYSLKLDFNFST